MFEPELKVGYFVKIVGTIALDNKLFRIDREEPLRYITGDEDTAIFTAVASAAESGFLNIEVLEPDETPRRLAKLLWGVRSGGKYYLKLPTGTNRLGIDEDKDVGYVTNEISPYCQPNPEWMFWLVNDYYPAINLVNDTLFTLTPQVYFQGTKYDIVEVTDPAIKDQIQKQGRFTTVTVGGVKGS